MIEFLAFVLAIVAYLFFWNVRRIWVEYHYNRGYKRGYDKGRQAGIGEGRTQAINEVWDDVAGNGIFIGHGRERRYWVSVPVEWLENSPYAPELNPPTPPKGRLKKRGE